MNKDNGGGSGCISNEGDGFAISEGVGFAIDLNPVSI